MIFVIILLMFLNGFSLGVGRTDDLSYSVPPLYNTDADVIYNLMLHLENMDVRLNDVVTQISYVERNYEICKAEVEDLKNSVESKIEEEFQGVIKGINDKFSVLQDVIVHRETEALRKLAALGLQNRADISEMVHLEIHRMYDTLSSWKIKLLDDLKQSTRKYVTRKLKTAAHLHKPTTKLNPPKSLITSKLNILLNGGKLEPRPVPVSKTEQNSPIVKDKRSLRRKSCQNSPGSSPLSVRKPLPSSSPSSTLGLYSSSISVSNVISHGSAPSLTCREVTVKRESSFLGLSGMTFCNDLPLNSHPLPSKLSFLSRVEEESREQHFQVIKPQNGNFIPGPMKSVIDQEILDPAMAEEVDNMTDEIDTFDKPYKGTEKVSVEKEFVGENPFEKSSIEEKPIAREPIKKAVIEKGIEKNPTENEFTKKEAIDEFKADSSKASSAPSSLENESSRKEIEASELTPKKPQAEIFEFTSNQPEPEPEPETLSATSKHQSEKNETTLKFESTEEVPLSPDSSTSDNNTPALKSHAETSLKSANNSKVSYSAANDSPEDLPNKNGDSGQPNSNSSNSIPKYPFISVFFSAIFLIGLIL